jgi:hypothetical protein
MEFLQPPFSPNFTPSNFYLFGHMKEWLSGFSFIDADQLLQSILVLLSGIGRVTLQAIVFEWMGRLRKCIKVHGGYIE